MNRFQKQNFRLLLKFTKYLLPYWKKELVVIILGELIVVFGLANPYLGKLLIDRGILGKDLNFFILIAVAITVLFVLIGTINAFVRYLSGYINSKINLDLNRDVFKHLNKLSFAFFQSKSSGEHLYKINSDLDRISDFITHAISNIATTLPRALFIFAIIFYLDRRIAILALCLVPFLFICPYYFMRKMRIVYKDFFQHTQEIFERLTEVFSHIHLIKAFGKEAREFKDYIGRLNVNIRLSLKATKLSALNIFSGSAISRVIAGIIFFYGGYRVIEGQLTFGSVAAIMLYINQLFSLQSKFTAFSQQLTSGMLSCERIEEILNQNPYKESATARPIKFDKGEIIFDNITFAYEKKKPVLENMNFRINVGSRIALVGSSGSGKTTIANLILRLYEPQKGKIFIDGYDLKELKSNSIYSQIGIALQEPFLWNDSIENNIRYGKEDAEFTEIAEAGRLVGLDNFISMLSDGYKTKIGENATLISQGQKQRLAIARAIIKNPQIIILDEAMSSLDSESEVRIIENLKKNFSTSTIIVVSHRLSTARKMDLIYFLKASDKVEIASCEKALEANKELKEIFADQFEPESSYNP